MSKSLVCLHQHKYDAQAIFHELSAYALKSPKALLDAATMLTYITSACLGDGHWKGTTQAFILHWQDQVCKYYDLATGQTFADGALCTMLENAVHGIDILHTVKTAADQQKVHSGTELTYTQYTSLLHSAAQTYDKTMMAPKAKAMQHCVYEHDFVDVDTSVCSIVSDLETLTINAAAYTPQPVPCLTQDQWNSLTAEAHQTWDQLSNEAKAIILQP